jgi:hypothetical protein
VLRHYPRIANVLALSWNDPASVREYLFDLLIDRRGGREGFPEDVRAELLVLRAYLEDCHVRTAPRTADGRA